MAGNKAWVQNGIGVGARMYRTIWRWHFYAGLFCIPFVVLLSLSGAIYLFKPQIDHWNDRSYTALTGVDSRAPANAQIQAAIAALPGADFVSYQLPESDRDAVLVTVRLRGEAWLVYVHPASLAILKTVAAEDQFIRLVRSFHGELLAGNAGSVLVELAACWTIVLIITGLYLGWPRGAKGLAGVLYPRLRQGQRLLWRDLHAVAGIWMAGFALFLLVSGLPWTLVWGGAFKELRQLEKAPHHQPAPDWSLGRSSEMTSFTTVTAQPVDLTPALLTSAQALAFAPPVVLAPDLHQPGVWTVKSLHPNRPLRADAWLLAANGAVVKMLDFADRPLLDRIVGIGVAAHEGQLFGWQNQCLGLLTALGLIVLSISGLVMWWRRKPAGGIGAPAALPEPAAARVVTAVTMTLGLLLPVLGLSLLMLLIVDWLLLRHCMRIRHWLGLSGAG